MEIADACLYNLADVQHCAHNVTKHDTGLDAVLGDSMGNLPNFGVEDLSNPAA